MAISSDWLIQYSASRSAKYQATHPQFLCKGVVYETALDSVLRYQTVRLFSSSSPVPSPEKKNDQGNNIIIITVLGYSVPFRMIFAVVD